MLLESVGHRSGRLEHTSAWNRQEIYVQKHGKCRISAARMGRKTWRTSGTVLHPRGKPEEEDDDDDDDDDAGGDDDDDDDDDCDDD